MRRQLRGILGLCLMMTAAFSTVCFAAEKPKYIFLFIGDGMSIPQRMMTETYLSQTGQPGLTINSFPYQVMTRTRSADSVITDSAAGGTAIACGSKTNNGVIGLDAEGNRLESVAEKARDAGKKVGIITSVTLNHATPAAFYGHNASRGNGYALGLDMIASKFDYFAGGGIDGHSDKTPDIYDAAAQAGYQVSHDREGFDALKAGDGKAITCKKDGALPYAIDDDGGLRIADYTAKAIELLDNPKGFFVMVEGGKIDWMCHANDAGTVLKEVIDLDKAVKVAVKFAETHPDTLIVVTGDHETGGLTLGFEGTGYETYNDRLSYQTCSGDAFDQKLRDIRKEKGNDLTFDDVKPLITESFGLVFDANNDDDMNVTPEADALMREAFDRAFPNGDCNANKLTQAVVRCFDHKAGLGWTSHAHTALPVNTTAVGPGSEGFVGMIENTDISKKLKALLAD